MFPRIPALLLALATGAASTLMAADVVVIVRDAKGQPVRDAVVSVLPLSGPAATARATAKVEIEQRGQEFHPYVTVVQTGTTVGFPNRDSVEHHLYSEAAAKRFEVPLYAPGREEALVFDRPGIVPMGCNIHDWMVAYLVVVDTPWFLRSDANGEGRIASVPPGRYRADVWHPRLGRTLQREVEVREDAALLEFSLPLKPDRRVRRGADTGSQGYR